MAPLIWLVTGATSGIGSALVNHIVARGDRVIASGRKVEQRIGNLKSDNVAILELDIAAKSADIDVAVEKAWGIFGRIDVLMNNAGMSAMRAAEEAESVSPFHFFFGK
jgi:NAD(P)-dependent dehydrogenase (short-subunit alcohol dehydrogenase family)